MYIWIHRQHLHRADLIFAILLEVDLHHLSSDRRLDKKHTLTHRSLSNHVRENFRNYSINKSVHQLSISPGHLSFLSFILHRSFLFLTCLQKVFTSPEVLVCRETISLPVMSRVVVLGIRKISVPIWRRVKEY